MGCSHPFVLPVPDRRQKGEYNLHVVSCWRCKACRGAHVDDWVGRSLAEASTSDFTVFVTLSYEDGHLPGDVRQGYRNVQHMLKRLRYHGQRSGDFSVRFFCVGEGWSGDGHRPHWHMLLFFRGRDFPVPQSLWMDRGEKWRFWPHGWTAFKSFGPESAGYVCKYILKAEDFEVFKTSSLKPALGAEFLEARARENVAAGLPFSDRYQFLDVCHDKPRGLPGRKVYHPGPGKPRNFRLRGASLDNCLRLYADGWGETYGREAPHLTNDQRGVLSRLIDADSNSSPERQELRLELRARRRVSPSPELWEVSAAAARVRAGRPEKLASLEGVGFSAGLFEDGTAHVVVDGQERPYLLDGKHDLAAWARQIDATGLDVWHKAALKAWIVREVQALPHGRFPGRYAPQRKGQRPEADAAASASGLLSVPRKRAASVLDAVPDLKAERAALWRQYQLDRATARQAVLRMIAGGNAFEAGAAYAASLALGKREYWEALDALDKTGEGKHG